MEQQPSQPSPDFVQGLDAALAFWRRRIQNEPPARLEAERHNLYRAVQFGLSLPGTQDTAAAVAAESFPFVLARGYWQEWLPVLERAVAVASPAQVVSRFWLLTRLGNLRRLSGNLSGSLSAHREALHLAAQSEQPLLLAEARFHLGRALRDAHRYPEALERLQAAEQIVEQFDGVDADTLAGHIYNALGRVAHDQGRLSEAQDYLQRAVALRRKLHLTGYLADDLHDLGNVLHHTGAHDAAWACFDEALTLLTGTGHRLRRIQTEYDMGILHIARQDFAGSEAVFRQIDMSFLRETGNLDLQARILVSLGNALLYQKRYEEAVGALDESISLWQRLEDEINLANAVGSLGEALAGMGQARQAHDKFAEALALLADYPDDAMATRLRTFFQAEQEKVAGQVAD